MRLRAALFALALGALPAFAQDQATLVADSMQISNDQVLTASGNVEVFYQGQRLRAESLRYDRGADSLAIDGPITLDDGAEIEADLTGLADVLNGKAGE